jgi:hypothetical protein
MYGKLFTSMYDGTLAATGPWQALVTFQQMIALADKDGVVDMTAAAISRRTSIPLEIIELGLVELMKPDPNSRTPAEEGRRIVLLESHRNWGWQLVNYKHYAALRSAEERREYLRVAQEKHRAKKKASTPVNTVNPASTLSTHVDVDVDVSVDAGKTTPTPPGGGVPPLKPASGAKGASGAKKASAPAKPDGVEQQVWDDWLALRKAKKAPVTETVLKRAKDEAAKAGLSLDGFLIVWCARGSQGLEASWLKPSEIGGRVVVDTEPAWVKARRDRFHEFIGKKPAESKVINMGEVFDVTATKLG